jgi:hypothetical protein
VDEAAPVLVGEAVVENAVAGLERLEPFRFEFTCGDPVGQQVALRSLNSTKPSWWKWLTPPYRPL